MSDQELQKNLRAHGFELARQRKHRVYKDRAGRTFVTSSTPSDRRWSAKALADLVRMCGPTGRDSRPLRARRRHGRLEPAFACLPADVVKPPRPPVNPDPAPALSRADQQRLKRREKHQVQRGAKIERQRAQLSDIARRAHEFMEDEGWEPEPFTDCACATFWHIKALGFQDVALAAADIVVNGEKCAIGIYVRVNGWFVDIFDNALRESPTWAESRGVMVEVFSDIRPEEFASFVGSSMYFGCSR
jgi:predicted RNA binding protein YcfA (HicA-like mRNA interferase family)